MATEEKQSKDGQLRASDDGADSAAPAGIVGQKRKSRAHNRGSNGHAAAETSTVTPSQDAGADVVSSNGHTAAEVPSELGNGHSVPTAAANRHSASTSTWPLRPSPLFTVRFGPLSDLVLHIGPELAQIADSDALSKRAAALFAETLGIPIALWRLQPPILRRDPNLAERKDTRHLSLVASDNLDPGYRQMITAFTAAEASVKVVDADVAAIRQQAAITNPTIATWLKRQPTLVSDIRQLVHSGIAELDQAMQLLIAAGVRTVYSIPLLSGKRLIGVIDLYYTEERQFLPGEESWLQMAATQVANSFEYAEFQEETGRKTAEALLLREISQMINRSLDLDETLDAILTSVRRLVFYDAANISLLDRSQTRLVVRRLAGDSGQQVKVGDAGKLDQGFSGQVATERKLLLVSDALESDIKPASPEVEPGQRWRSYIGLPILQGENLLGTLELISMKPNAFNDDDVRLLGNIAEQAAAAIDNARLHEEANQRNKELALLQEVSASINASLDLKATLRTILLSVGRIINYKLGEVTLFDSLRNVLVSQFTTGMGTINEFTEEYRLDEFSYSGWLGRNPRPLLINNAAERDSYGIVSNSSVRSYLGVPMMISGRLIGTIEISADVDYAYSENDLNILTLVANQSAVAVENARLYESADQRLARRLMELTILQRIGQEMNSTFDVNQIFNMVVGEAVKVTGALFGAILDVDKELAHLNIRAVAGDLSDSNIDMLDRPLQLGSGLMSRAVEIGESLLISDVTENTDYIAISPRIKSELMVPIRYEEEVVGLIDLNSASIDGFDLEHLHFVESLAWQTATAIGVAQSYAEQVRQGQQLTRRASQLSQVLEIGSSLTPDRPIDDVLDQVANAIADTLNYRFVIVSLVEGEGEERYLRRIASAGLPLAVFEEFRTKITSLGEAEKMLQERFRIGRSYFIPSELRADLHPIDVLSLIDDEARRPGDWQQHDMLIVPMYSTNGDLLGWISVDDPSDRLRPNRNTVEALEVFANQAAGAVENARLINSYRQRIFELDAISNIGRDVTANLDIAAMCAAVYSQLQRIMKADAFYVALAVDDMLVSLSAMDKGEPYDLPTVPLKGSLSERVIKQGQALLLNGLVDTVGMVPPNAPGILIASGVPPHSWLGVPLRIGENIIGVLSVQHYGTEAYGKREEQLLTTIANQLAPAIQNARLFERNQERVGELAMLNEVGSSLSTIREEQSLYDQAYSSTIKLLGARSFTIALRGSDHNLDVVFHRSSTNDATLSGGTPLMGSLTGVVVDTRRSLLIGNLDDPNQWPLHTAPSLIEGGTEAGNRSWLGVPLIVGDQALGALVVQDAQARAFSNEQATLFTLFANQFAIALSNADLFERNQRRINELAALTELGRELTASHNIEEISRIAQTRLQQLIPLDVFLLGFYEPGSKDELHIPYLFNDGQEVFDISAELGNGPGAWVITHHEPLLISDVLDPREAPEGADELTIIEGEGLIHGWMGAPLLAGDKAIGLVSVQYDGRNVYTNDHLQLLTTVANQLAIALQNAQSFAHNQQRIGDLALINEAARDITANLDVDQICELLYQRSQQLFDNDSLMLGIYDAEKQLIDIIYFRERVNAGGRQIVNSIQFGQGLSSKVITEHRPLLVKDLNDPNEVEVDRTVPRIGTHPELLTRSWMGVPLLRGEEVIGVLNIQSYKVAAFSEEQIPLLGTLAGQVVVALQNAQLFQRNTQRINELAALSDLGRELTSQLDVVAIGRTIYGSIKDSFPLDSYFMMLYDERRDTGHCPVIVDDGEFIYDDLQVALSNSLSSFVIQQRKPLMIADMNDPALLPDGKTPMIVGKEISTRSSLAVPMIIGNRVLGVISVQSYSPGAYSDNELQFLSTVASQASVAIENANLFEQYKQRINELNSLNELTRSVTASMHVDAVAVSVYEHIKKFVDLDVFMLALYDEEHNLISWPFSMEAGERIADVLPQPLGVGITSIVVESQKPLIVDDALDPKSMPDGALPIRVGSDQLVRSWAGAPMMVGRQVMGVISVQNYEPGQYDLDNIRPLLSVANQAAIAIQNAKLFDERERKIAELATINQMAKEIGSSLQIDELLQLIYNQVTQVMSTRNFLITLYDERRQEIQYRFMREHGRSVTRPTRKLGPGFISQIVDSRQPLLINYDSGRYAAERGWEHVGEPSRSWLGVPMVSGDQVLGVIAVQSYETEGAYDTDDLSLLSTIGSQAAVAIEKATLFEETQNRVLQLDTLNEIGRILGAVLDEETVFQKIFEHTTRSFDDLSSFYIGLYQRDQGIITFPFAVEDEQRIEMAASPLGEGLTSYVIANRRALLIDDLELMAREYEGYRAKPDGKTTGERSWMGVPLFLGGEVIGLISMQSRKPNAYRQDDLQFLSTLANQAAVAIKNAKLFEEIREFNATLNRTVAERTEALGRANQELRTEKERISQLYDITHQLTTSLDLEDILNRGLHLVANAIGVERGSIMTIDPITNGLIYRAALGQGRSNRVGLRMPWKPGEGAVGWAVANRTPLLIADTSNDSRWVKDNELGQDVGSIISVPLMSGSDVFGVLSLVSPQRNYFNESHLRLVSTVANEMAVFTHNAELYSYISEQAEALASSLIVQEQEASRSRAILESIADGVLVFDGENRITLVNPAAEVILGVAGELLMNRHVPFGLRNLELVPELLDLVQSVVSAAREGTPGALSLNRRRFIMNNRVISVSLSPVTTSKREALGLVAVLRDITREVEIEREKSDFVSTVSHELRTPMTVIKGHTDLLLAGAVGAISPMQSSFLQAVKRNTDRMNTLVSDLLTVSRIETGRMAISMQPNYYEASELVDSVVQTLRSLAEAKNQQLIFNVDGELPEVLIDRDRTVQVLTNLISNSIKYTPNNGRIQVNVGCAADGEVVQVDVIDDGIGIAEKDQEKLFQPFYRSDNAEAKVQEGTGLGLVIAKSLVELQGGRLWLKSKLGEGTTFSFTMPAYKEKEDTVSQVGDDGRRGKARIMVVDDDPQVANGLAAALEREGYVTMVAYSGRKAVELASQERLDLITMDIVMPEMDGFETMKALSDDPNSAGVPILIVSLVSESEQGFALGAAGYLTKPATPTELIRSVEQALAVHTVRHDGPVRILIIDDEHDIVSGLEAALREEGFSVFAAFSGEEGLSRVGEYHPDVILLDMRMPGMNGAEVLTKLKHAPTTRSIPVIILTASEARMDEARVRVIGLGAREILTKPFSIGDIVNEIKKALPGEDKDELDG